MAADCQLTDGSIAARYEKKIRKVDGHLLGGAGSPDDLELFFDWYQRSLTNPRIRAPKLSDKFEGLAVTPDGDIFTYGRRLVALKIEEPFYAIGSGYALAFGALESGASPEEAVMIAIKRDIYSGLGVVTIERDVKRRTVQKGTGVRATARGGIRQRPKRSGRGDEVRDIEESTPERGYKKPNKRKSSGDILP